MIGGPVDFDWMNYTLRSPDVLESHRYNYLRHRLWVKEQAKKKSLEIL